MLLINGLITLLGTILALIVYSISALYAVTGIPLIVIGSVFFYLYLIGSDLIEIKLIEMFNKDPD